MHTLPRDADGKLPAYAWPGGYPLVYYVADSEPLCPDCANGGNGSLASETLDPECPDDNQWRLVGVDIHYEGPPETCAHCGWQIPSAYGDPDARPEP
jgi:hypothetical protein